jgi:hypothetical protein
VGGGGGEDEEGDGEVEIKLRFWICITTQKISLGEIFCFAIFC